MTCAVTDCGYQAPRRGWCFRHYRSWRIYGDPLTVTRPRRGEMAAWLAKHRNYQGGGCLIWPFTRRPDGYSNRLTTPDGRKLYAHQYMCELANGPTPPERESAHSCGNGHLGCVHPKHLRWATFDDNAHDRIQHGTQVAGSRHPMAALTEAQVRQIKVSDKSGAYFADLFGVARSSISRIRTGKRWSGVQ